MKQLLISLFICLSSILVAQTSEPVYCIQIMATRNVHLVKPEMVSMCEFDTVLVEKGENGFYRLIIAYPSREEAEIYFTTWQRSHSKAFICTRTRKAISKMEPLYTNIKN